MKTLTKWASIALFLILAACAGNTARQQVLLPALRNAWPPVREIVAAELQQAPDVAVAEAVDSADAAVQTGSPAAVAAVAWPLIDAKHKAGVQRLVGTGAVGEGVAVSLRERLRQFADARATFVSGGQ